MLMAPPSGFELLLNTKWGVYNSWDIITRAAAYTARRVPSLFPSIGSLHPSTGVNFSVYGSPQENNRDARCVSLFVCQSFVSVILVRIPNA